MLKVGILGGGQLGRMLLQEGANYPVETWVLENDASCPARHLCHHFVKGNIRSYDDVLQFGRQVDVLTIEIEHVDIEALETLEKEGIRVIPNTSTLRIIRDKVLQKEFYSQHSIPTPAYQVVLSKTELQALPLVFPVVQKLGTGGYDGRGVQILNGSDNLASAFDAPSIVEQMVAMDKEIAILVAVDGQGSTAVYPPVEMVFDQDLNQLDYQLCPALLPQQILWKAEAIALSVARKFASPGIFAVELFVDKNGDVLVNETAPRVHNSGHHTIEAHYSSQFDMLWRILLGYPLGNPEAIMPSVMINLIGEPGTVGETDYEGLEKMLELEHGFVHLYGKRESRPGRKMGHITVMSTERQELLHQANRIRHLVRVKGKSAI